MGNGAHPWRVHSLPGRGSLPSRSWTHSGGVQVLPVSTGPTFPRWGRFSHPREVGTLSVSVFPPRSQIPQFRTRKILRTGVRALRFGRKKSALRVASHLPPRCEVPRGSGGPPPPRPVLSSSVGVALYPWSVFLPLSRRPEDGLDCGSVPACATVSGRYSSGIEVLSDTPVTGAASPRLAYVLADLIRQRGRPA